MIGEKTIGSFIVSQAAQDCFARLSGDWNPVHRDGVEAERSSFGQPIVHGMNVVLTALELFCARGTAVEIGRAPEKLHVQFIKPVFIGEDLTLVMHALDAKRARLVVRAGAVDLVKVNIGFSTADRPLPQRKRLDANARSAPPRREPINRAIEDGGDLTAELPLAVDAAAMNAAFPESIVWCGERCVASLALLSAAVGMEWPGALSLFTEVKVSFAATEEGTPDKLVLHVDLIKPEHRYTVMRVAAPDFAAEISAFFRPGPVEPLTDEELRDRVVPGAFDGWTMVAVGGSRGLGAVAARLMAAGGARVILTYRSAITEAANVRDDIVARGGNCVVLQHDAASGKLLLPEKSKPAEKVLLFFAASPRIFRRRRDTFVKAWFDEFIAVYVDGFLDAAQAVMAWADGPISILYPSSQALDEPIRDLVEYAAAKSAGEVVCRSLLTAKRLRIKAPRLPRLLTDQTNTVVQTKSERPVDVLLPLLFELTVDR